MARKQRMAGDRLKGLTQGKGQDEAQSRRAYGKSIEASNQANDQRERQNRE